MSNENAVPLFTLTTGQRAALTAYRDAGQYPGAYNYLKGLVRDQMTTADAATKRDLESTATWLDRAAAINANDGSFGSEFVRGATREASNINGRPISEQRFQEVSDGLARDVIENVLDKNGMPKSGEIIGLDVKSAIEKLGLKPWQWAGTLGDILPPPFGLGKDYKEMPAPEWTRDSARDWLHAGQAQLTGFARWQYKRFASTDPFTGMPTDDIDPSVNTAISPTLGTTPDPLVKTIIYVDPLILDLDGDGLEITPLAKGVLFDANGDSIKTGTAWAGADDGMLVWDRDGNGLIDSGRELFGDETMLANGQKAAHGFAALSELDTGSVVNGVSVGAADGVFNAKDARYANVRVWRDLNQDGISQAGELQTLAQSGVTSIQLGSSATNTQYGDAILAHSSTFTRANGSTGQAGSFILAQNNFADHREPASHGPAQQHRRQWLGARFPGSRNPKSELIAMLNQDRAAADYRDSAQAGAADGE